jgi:hypothetical protein
MVGSLKNVTQMIFSQACGMRNKASTSRLSMMHKYQLVIHFPSQHQYCLS